MATWAEFEAETPELAGAALDRLRAHKHLTIATLRRDGSPRISGIEFEIVGGDLQLGSMWQAVKALDLQRDPRFALHSGSDDRPGWSGDAKVAGRVTELDDDAKLRHRDARGGEVPDGPFHLFSCDIAEVVVVGLNDARDKLVVQMWHEGRGTSQLER